MAKFIISFFYCTSIICFTIQDIKTTCASLKNNILVVIKNDDAVQIWDIEKEQKLADLPSILATSKCAISDDASLITLVADKEAELWKKYEDGWQKYDFILSKPLSPMDDIACGTSINQGSKKSFFFISHIYPYEDGLVQEQISISHRKKYYYPIKLNYMKINFLSRYNPLASKIMFTYVIDNKATHVLIYDLKKKKVIFTYVILARIYNINFIEDENKCLLLYSDKQKTTNFLLLDFNLYAINRFILNNTNIINAYIKNNILYVITKENVFKYNLQEKIISKI